MLYTMLPAPLTSPLATTLLPTRSPTIASCSIGTDAPPLYANVLLSRLLHQIPRVCVKIVRLFGRLALRQQQLHCTYADAMRMPFLWTPHHLTQYALAASSMLFSIRTRFFNGGKTFTIHSDQHHRYNNTALSTARIRSSARAFQAT